MSDVEYVHVGDHADILASARSIGPGERVSSSELTHDDEGNLAHVDQVLIDEGVLVDVASFDQGEHNGAAVKEAAEAASTPAAVTPAPPAPAATTAKQEGDSNANA